MSSSRKLLVIAIVTAFVAGLVQGIRGFLPSYLSSAGYGIDGISTIISALTIFLLVVDPLAIFALGYLWGQRTTVPTEYLGFGGRLFVAALAGFVIGYAAIVASVPDLDGSIIRTGTVSAVAGLKTATNLAFAALAASALAHFRGRYRPSPA